MATGLDKRVFVGVSRGVWDCIGRAISDSLCSLEDGDAAEVLPSRQPRLGYRAAHLHTSAHPCDACTFKRSLKPLETHAAFVRISKLWCIQGTTCHQAVCVRSPAYPFLTGKAAARRGHWSTPSTPSLSACCHHMAARCQTFLPVPSLAF